MIRNEFFPQLLQGQVRHYFHEVLEDSEDHENIPVPVLEGASDDIINYIAELKAKLQKKSSEQQKQQNKFLLQVYVDEVPPKSVYWYRQTTSPKWNQGK